MSEMIFNIVSQKTISSNKNNNFLNIIDESDLSGSVFNKLNKCLLRKEIEFDNVFTEEKKDDKDENIICANFIINNLLNILNKKDISVNSKKSQNIKDNEIEKKKLDEDQNNLLETVNFLKNIKKPNKKNIKEIFKTLKTETVLSRSIKDQNQFNQINNINTKKKLDLKKNNYQFLQKKINISNINKNNMTLTKDKKEIIFLSHTKKNKSSLTASKNINKIDNIIIKRNSLPIFHKKEFIKSNIEPLILNDSKNSIEWKKLISHKIFLSIANKNNQAEIHLKPESLGSIHIVINMEKNAATLQFISKYKEVRTFLNSYMPFLSNSLTKNGIKLEKFHICSSLKNKKIQNHKNLLYKNIHYSDNFKKIFNTYEKKIDCIKYKPIDIYV